MTQWEEDVVKNQQFTPKFSPDFYPHPWTYSFCGLHIQPPQITPLPLKVGTSHRELQHCRNLNRKVTILFRVDIFNRKTQLLIKFDSATFFSLLHVNDTVHCLHTQCLLIEWKHGQTRMHSSRMRTVCCSSRLRGVSGRGVFTRGCLAKGVSARGDVCPGGVSAQGGVGWGCHTHPPCEQNHRRLWKHYLAATTLRTVIRRLRLFIWPCVFCCEWHLTISLFLVVSGPEVNSF